MYEQRIAEFFGTCRTPLSGGNSRHTESDSLHKLLFIECKLRAKIPFGKTIKETEQKAKKEGKIPVVVVHKKNSPHNYAIIELGNLKEIANVLHKPIKD